MVNRVLKSEEIQILKVLDIDLDFFLTKKHIGSVTSKRRLNKKYYKPWKEEEVIEFLEKKCGLSQDNRINGNFFVHHVELFYFLRELREKNNFNFLYSIDHIDAHADLGMGDASYIYISSNLLHKSITERAYPKKKNGYSGLSSGNYLAFAIAARWISDLTYVNNLEWVTDLPRFHFKDFSIDSEIIQLKKFKRDVLESMVFNGIDLKEGIPLELEPEVPFKVCPFNEFKYERKYDLLFLTQSPGFTPKAADKLIPIIKRYMLNE